MTRRTLLPAVALAALLSAMFAWRHFSVRRGAPAESYAYLASDRGLKKLWAAPPFSYVDQHGEQVSRESLLHRPWIADFIYTGCTSACPMMTSRMIQLQHDLAGLDLRFVSFSVDPGHDTPQVLAAYARTWNRAETRWALLSTDAGRLGDTLAGFRVTAQRVNNPASPIVHSSVFLLVDADGWVRGVYDSIDEGARSRLAADARRLAGQVPPSGPGPAATGGDLYASLGCPGCHANRRIAPSLDGLRGTVVTLDDGTTVTADDAYLRRSIVDPAGQLVPGYPASMPSYAELSAAQVQELVGEVAAMKSDAGVPAAASARLVRSGPAVAPTSVADAPRPQLASIVPGPQDTRTAADTVPRAAAPATATDPVCGMPVRVEPETLRTSSGGRELYFCSQRCRDSFLADPARYARATH